MLGLGVYVCTWLITFLWLREDGSSIRFREGIFMQDYWVSDWGNVAFLIVLGPVALLAAYNYWRK
ncbi:MAG: hypothetical protein K2X34_10450 [Hyphomonadaceae bacterium]|nr:hypothetical protein [Hyphomonadaceae bacterium]